ncbi:ent-kaurene synthase [Neofusicoccum parvum]|uniref:Ent-kaurene synthase n=1 Tax=Neofusicoccum parvum TaxID=310453 RepID=A0ACB5SD40_9PEZI|nr:ent-kaurene synthase [Neofusicoccum parvum]GME53048.1 ent-kaurene synthase [Neofusicoccum parvum]
MTVRSFEPEEANALDYDARTLLQEAFRDYDDHYGLGSMSVALDDGSWESCASEVDGILNTAASLISLKRHAEEPLQMDEISLTELESRIERAIRALASKLASWNVSASTHVGFEIIVPTLLEELEKQDITFDFRGREQLLKINASKLSRFKPAYLYGNVKTTALHSLEAFIGKVDFDRILSTLLKSGYSAAELESLELRKGKDVLAQCFEKEGGTIGFDNVSRYMPQILKCVKFICMCWWENAGSIKDKWNLSYLYPSMLLVESLVTFLTMSDQGHGSGLLDQELESRISVSLCQASLRVMLQQQEDGSWNGSPEQTSYAILTLVQARRVAFFKSITTELDYAIKRGRAFLLASPKHQSVDHLWIEKVSYTSPLLSKAYILAALKGSATQGSPAVGQEPATTDSQLNRLVAFYQRTPLFFRTPSWQLRASLIEASLFEPLLRARHLSIFPRDGLEAPRYLELIPFTWTGSNNRAQTFASASFLLEMMVVSMLNYQADEFMEAVAAPAFAGDLGSLRAHIDRLFTNPRKRSFDVANGVSDMRPSNGVGKRLDNNDKLRPLSRFITHTLTHSAVAAASAHDAALVHRELRTFLLGHVDQAKADARFQATGCCSYRSPTHSFFAWVRGPSADHTSCPYSFALMCALLSNGSSGGGSERADCFPAADQKYFAAALCRHLATMCRLYNDAGSVARDRAEGTLNGLDFDEFAGFTLQSSAV